MSFAAIAGERLRASEAERERYLKRAGAGLAVILIHVLFLLGLLTAGYVHAVRQKTKPTEIVFILPPPAIHPEQVRPVLPTVVPQTKPQEVPTRPITLPPPTPPQSQTHSPTDVLQAIGKELACGAGPYEHLSQAEREACKRQPWKFKKNAKGVIVLDALPPPAQLDAPAASGADAERHKEETADPCLAAGNTHSQCIHKTIFGR